MTSAKYGNIILKDSLSNVILHILKQYKVNEKTSLTDSFFKS